MKISFKYIALIKPLLFFGFIMILLVFSVSLVYSNTQRLFTKIEAAKADRFLLEERLAVLRDTEPDLGTNIAQTAVGVLPSENPSLLVISQIRKLATENSVTLDNVTLNARQIEGEEYPSVEINFKAKGAYSGVSKLIESLANYAPLMNLSQLKMSGIQNEIEAQVSVQSFWTPFPTKLPALSEQITGLSNEERSLMDKLTNFKKADVFEVSSLKPQETEEREDPFSSKI
jgi:hypothetical protein